MIDQEMFEDSSKATIIKDNLSNMALTTSENNKKRMKELKKQTKKTKPGAKLKGGMGGGDSSPPPPTPYFAGTGEVCRAKMWNLICENKNTITAKYFFVTN